MATENITLRLVVDKKTGEAKIKEIGKSVDKANKKGKTLSQTFGGLKTSTLAWAAALGVAVKAISQFSKAAAEQEAGNSGFVSIPLPTRRNLARPILSATRLQTRRETTRLFILVSSPSR